MFRDDRLMSLARGRHEDRLAIKELPAPVVGRRSYQARNSATVSSRLDRAVMVMMLRGPPGQDSTGRAGTHVKPGGGRAA
jgi:hypothetical protein